MTNDVRSFWAKWLFVLSIGIIMGGLFLAVIVPYFLPQVQNLFYSDFTSMNTFEELPLHDKIYANWMLSVIGSILLGWGVLFAFLSYHLISEDTQWIWNSIIISTVCWYILDTLLSFMAGSTANVILNTTIFVFAAIPFIGHFLESRHQN